MVFGYRIASMLSVALIALTVWLTSPCMPLAQSSPQTRAADDGGAASDSASGLRDSLLELREKLADQRDENLETRGQLMDMRSEQDDYLGNWLIVGLTTFSALAAIIGISVFSYFRNRLNEHIESHVERATSISLARMQIFANNEFAYTWFGLYEPRLMQFMAKPASLNDEVREQSLNFVKNAQHVACTGLDHLRRVWPEDIEKLMENREFCRSRIHILNHKIYAQAAEIVLQHGKIDNRDQMPEFLAECEELRQLAICRAARNQQFEWYMAYETTGFFTMIAGMATGDSGLEDSGKAFIEKLCRGQRPDNALSKPSPEWCKATKKQYCHDTNWDELRQAFNSAGV